MHGQKKHKKDTVGNSVTFYCKTVIVLYGATCFDPQRSLLGVITLKGWQLNTLNCGSYERSFYSCNLRSTFYTTA